AYSTMRSACRRPATSSSSWPGVRIVTERLWPAGGVLGGSSTVSWSSVAKASRPRTRTTGRATEVAPLGISVAGSAGRGPRAMVLPPAVARPVCSTGHKLHAYVGITQAEKCWAWGPGLTSHTDLIILSCTGNNVVDGTQGPGGRRRGHGRSDSVRDVSAERSGRDRRRRCGAGADRPLRDRPALAGARGLADLDRRALDQARLAVGDDLLACLEPLGDDRVVALVSGDDDGPRLDRRVRLDDEDVGALLTGLDRRRGRDDRIGLDGQRHSHVHELTGPETPLLVGKPRLETNGARGRVNGVVD